MSKGQCLEARTGIIRKSLIRIHEGKRIFQHIINGLIKKHIITK
jgi:hypothetical protein